MPLWRQHDHHKTKQLYAVKPELHPPPIAGAVDEEETRDDIDGALVGSLT
jgi:hypothetical protein